MQTVNGSIQDLIIPMFVGCLIYFDFIIKIFSNTYIYSSIMTSKQSPYTFSTSDPSLLSHSTIIQILWIPYDRNREILNVSRKIFVVGSVFCYIWINWWVRESQSEWTFKIRSNHNFHTWIFFIVNLFSNFFNIN